MKKAKVFLHSQNEFGTIEEKIFHFAHAKMILANGKLKSFNLILKEMRHRPQIVSKDLLFTDLLRLGLRGFK
jgi:hypothetical protein